MLVGRRNVPIGMHAGSHVNAVIHTRRLLMRRWHPDDQAPFSRINADRMVAEYLPAPLTPDESAAFIARIERHFDEHGFGLWALETRDNGELIGYTGLNIPSFEAAFTPCVEVGWRLAPAAWGKGYATEAARAALRVAFEQLALEQVLSWTVPANERSRAVMRRIGMTRAPELDFDHTRLPPGSRLRRHVMYRIARREWRAATPGI